MPNLLLLFSHRLTEIQKNELKQKWKIEEIIPLPERLQDVFSNIDPVAIFPQDTVKLLADWLNNESDKDDLVLIQGDFGITYYLVDWCLKNGRIAVYSTTVRDYQQVEMPEGEVKMTHIFKHVRFRKYRCYNRS